MIEIDSIKHKVYPGLGTSAEKISDQLISENKIKFTRVKCEIYGLKHTSNAIHKFTTTYIGEDKNGYNHIEEAIKKDLKKHRL